MQPLCVSTSNHTPTHLLTHLTVGWCWRQKAFKSDGFDPEIAAREAERLEKLDKDAEAKRQEEEEAAEMKRTEDAKADHERKLKEQKEQLARMQALEANTADRANSPNRRVVFVGNLVGAQPAHLQVPHSL